MTGKEMNKWNEKEEMRCMDQDRKGKKEARQDTMGEV